LIRGLDEVLVLGVDADESSVVGDLRETESSSTTSAAARFAMPRFTSSHASSCQSNP